MKTTIQTRGFELTESIKLYTERRLAFAVSFASQMIQRVNVRLSDINGPRGGNDKKCQVVFTLQGLPNVVIEDTESNFYVAIDRAVERASRALARVLERKHAHRTLGGRVSLSADIVN